MANKNMVRLGGAYVEITADNSKLVDYVKDSEDKLKNFASEFQHSAASMTAFGAAISVPMKKAVDYFGEFEKQMLITRAVTQSSERQMARLTNQAKELGATTSWTARQVAEGMTALGRMGFSNKEIERTITSVMDLGRALDVDVATSAKELGSVMRQFGADSSQAGHYADVLAKSTNSAAMEMSELLDTMKYVGSVGNAINMDVESVLALVAALRNAGATAAQAGTQLRSIFLKFQTPKNVQIFADKFGVDIKDANGRLKSFIDIVVEAQHRARALGDDMSSIARKMFGTLQAPGYINLLQATGLEEFRDELYNCDGAAEEFRKAMESGVFGSVKLSESAIEAITNDLGQSLAPVVSEVRDIIIDMSATVRQFIEDHKPLVSLLARTGLAFGTVGSILLSVVGVFKISSTFMHMLSAGATKIAMTWRATSAEAKRLKKETAALNAEMAKLKANEPNASIAAPFEAISTAAEAAAVSVGNLNAQLEQTAGSVISAGRVSKALFHKYNEGEVSFNSTSYLVGGGERSRYGYNKTNVDERTVMINGRSFKEDRAAAGEEFKERETGRIRGLQQEVEANIKATVGEEIAAVKSQAVKQRAILGQAHYEMMKNNSAALEAELASIDQGYNPALAKTTSDIAGTKNKIDTFSERVSLTANGIERWAQEQIAAEQNVVAAEKEKVRAIQESVRAEKFTSENLRDAQSAANTAYANETKGVKEAQAQILRERKAAVQKAESEYNAGLRNLFEKMSGRSYATTPLKKIHGLTAVTDKFLSEGGLEYNRTKKLKFGSLKEAADAFDSEMLKIFKNRNYDASDSLDILRLVRGKEAIIPGGARMTQYDYEGKGAKKRSLDAMTTTHKQGAEEWTELPVADRNTNSVVDAVINKENRQIAEHYKKKRDAFLAPYKKPVPTSESLTAFNQLLNENFDASGEKRLTTAIERVQNQIAVEEQKRKDAKTETGRTNSQKRLDDLYRRARTLDEEYTALTKEGGREANLQKSQNKYLEGYAQLTEERARKLREAETLREGEYASNNTVMVNAQTKRDTAISVAQQKFDAYQKYKDTVRATNAALKQTEKTQKTRVKEIQDEAKRLQKINAGDAKRGFATLEGQIASAKRNVIAIQGYQKAASDATVSVYAGREKANDAWLKEEIRNVDKSANASVAQITQVGKAAETTLHASAKEMIANIENTVKLQNEAVARESTAISLHGGVGKTTGMFVNSAGGLTFSTTNGVKPAFGISTPKGKLDLSVLPKQITPLQRPVRPSMVVADDTEFKGERNLWYKAWQKKNLLKKMVTDSRGRIRKNSPDYSLYKLAEHEERIAHDKYTGARTSFNLQRDYALAENIKRRDDYNRRLAAYNKQLPLAREMEKRNKASEARRAARPYYVLTSEYSAGQGLNLSGNMITTAGTSFRDMSVAATEATNATVSLNTAMANSEKAAGQLATVTSTTANATHTFTSETKQAIVNGQLYTVETNNAADATKKLGAEAQKSGKMAKVASAGMHALSFAAKGLAAVGKFFGGMMVSLAAWQGVMLVFEKIASFAKETAENMEKARQSNDELLNKDVEAADKAYANLETDEQKIDKLVEAAGNTEPVTASEKHKLDALYKDLASRGITKTADDAALIAPDQFSPSGYRVANAGAADWMKARAIELQLPELARQAKANKFDVSQLDPSKFAKFTELSPNEIQNVLKEYEGAYNLLSKLTPGQRSVMFGENKWFSGRWNPFSSGAGLFQKRTNTRGRWASTLLLSPAQSIFAAQKGSYINSSELPEIAPLIEETVKKVKSQGELSSTDEASLRSFLRQILLTNHRDFTETEGQGVAASLKETFFGTWGLSFLKSLTEDQGQGFMDTYKKLQDFGASNKAVEDLKATRDAFLEDAKAKSTVPFESEQAQAKAEAEAAAMASALKDATSELDVFQKKLDDADLTPAQRQLQELELMADKYDEQSDGAATAVKQSDAYKNLLARLRIQAKDELQRRKEQEKERLDKQVNEQATNDFAALIKDVRAGKINGDEFIKQYDKNMMWIDKERDLSGFYQNALTEIKGLVSDTKTTLSSVSTMNAFEFADMANDVVVDVQRQQLDQLRNLGTQARMIYSWMVTQDEYKDFL